MQTIETLGKYAIRRLLGRGAMGAVYEGWDPIIARRVAIKTVRIPDASDPETAEALARFRREAQAAGRLTHPNIVGVFDYGETDDLAYIVMEFVDGPTLKSLLDKQERFALADIVRIMDDLLAGLQFSHERGVVHRDIKPANVMLTSSGQAKIADFGIARIESSSMTQAGTVLGTPAYMSPEQFMGQVVDSRTDIYSSGVLLYQLLTGDRPFDGGMSAIMHKALNTEPPAPSLITVTAPLSLDAVVRRAMAKRPDDRFASAVAFAEAMRTALAHPSEPVGDDDATMVVAPVPSVLPSAMVLPKQPASRSTIPIIATAVAVLLLAFGGAAWWLVPRTVTQAPVQAVAINTPVPATPPAPAQTSAIVSSPLPLPSPAVQPENQQLTMARTDGLRRQIAQWASNQGCALLGGGVGDNGSAALSGLASNRILDDLRQGIAGIASPSNIDWRVNGVDHVFCPALDALHPIVPAFGATGGSRLGLEMADGKTRLHDGENVRVKLVMPDFASQLRVDYIVHDGSVQHLYPQLADPANGIKADTPRTYASGEPVDLRHPSWVIGAPYGTDMIIAVASSEPLFDHQRPRNAETVEAYLHDLQEAIDDARRRGVRMAGAAVTLEALPK